MSQTPVRRRYQETRCPEGEVGVTTRPEARRIGGVTDTWTVNKLVLDSRRAHPHVRPAFHCGSVHRCPAGLTGVAALILATQPTLSAAAVKTRLCEPAVPITLPPGVTIAGPSVVRPGATCLWTATATGTPPFGYTWSPVAGSANQMTYTNGATNFTVSVTVADFYTGQTVTTKSVTVSAGAPVCLF